MIGRRRSMKQRRTIGLAMNRYTGDTQGHGNMIDRYQTYFAKDITKYSKRKTCGSFSSSSSSMLEILCAIKRNGGWI
jgi:hypothetical protein